MQRRELDKIFFVGLIAVIFILVFSVANVYSEEDDGDNGDNGNSGNGNSNGGDDGDGDDEADEDEDDQDDEDETESEDDDLEDEDELEDDEEEFGNRIKFEKRVENGKEVEVKYEERIFFVDGGKVFRLRIEYREEDGKIEKKIKIEDSELEIEIEEELEIVEGESEDDAIEVRLSDGVEKEIKVMPETASARALEAIQKNACPPESCVIVLKEVGDDKTEKKIVYEMTQENEVRVLGLFRARLKSVALVDAEQNGEVISVEKSWWAFLATGD